MSVFDAEPVNIESEIKSKVITIFKNYTKCEHNNLFCLFSQASLSEMLEQSRYYKLYYTQIDGVGWPILYKGDAWFVQEWRALIIKDKHISLYDIMYGNI